MFQDGKSYPQKFFYRLLLNEKSDGRDEIFFDLQCGQGFNKSGMDTMLFLFYQQCRLEN
jgi:hypothetical protein